MCDIEMCKIQVLTLLQKNRRKKRKKNTVKMFISLFSLMLLYRPKLKMFGLLSLLLSPIQIRKDTE